MQTSGVFPQLSDGRKGRKVTKPARSGKKAGPEPLEDGRGYTRHQPRPVNAPKTTAGRRAASHAKAYGRDKEDC